MRGVGAGSGIGSTGASLWAGIHGLDYATGIPFFVLTIIDTLDTATVASDKHSI